MVTVPKEVTAFLDDFIARSPRTKANYENFANIFWRKINKPVADVTVEDILEFLHDGVQKNKWKISTMQAYATLALRFFGELRDEEFLKKLQKKVRLLPREQSHLALYEGNYVPPDRINDFIKAAPTEEYRVFYTLILKCGLRLSEALSISPFDFASAMKTGKAIVWGKGGVGGMGKIRHVYVEKSTIRTVLRYAGMSEDQISGLKPIRDQQPIIKSIKPRTAEYQWKRTAEQLHLPNWKKLTPHDGRHSYAIDFITRRKEQGMKALQLLMNQLGHSSITTTQIYLDFAGTEAQDVFNAGLEEQQ